MSKLNQYELLIRKDSELERKGMELWKWEKFLSTPRSLGKYFDKREPGGQFMSTQGIDRQAIMSHALRHGFTLRQQPGGAMDLNECVYAFAKEVFEAGRKAERAELEKQEPVFWYRPLRHAGMYEGPLHHNSPEGQFRRDDEPGEWVPLYAGPAHEASSNTYTMPDGVGGAKWAGLRAQGYRAIGLVLQNDHGETCSVTEHGRVMWDRKMAHPGYNHPEHALELVGLRGCTGGAERGEDQAAEAEG